MDVLQRHVHVAGDLAALRDGPDEVIRPVRRMRVQQPDPEIALQSVEFPERRDSVVASAARAWVAAENFSGEENGAAVIRAKVEAVVGGVLGDQVELPYAVTDQLARLGDHVRLGPAPVRTRIRGMMQKLHGWLQPSRSSRRRNAAASGGIAACRSEGCSWAGP